MTEYRELGVIVLGAGKGTRMKSDLPKVLHMIHSKTMIIHVIEAISIFSGAPVCVVVGHQARMVRKEVLKYFNVEFAFQERLLGTGDAVKAAIPKLPKTVKNVLILCGDVPLIKQATLKQLVDMHLQNRQSVSILTVDMVNPTGYGRIIQDRDGKVLRIVEEKDTVGNEKNLKKVNAGIYCFEKKALIQALELIQADNIQQEYYLTDAIEIISGLKGSIACTPVHDYREVIGVNTLEELKEAESMVRAMKNELP